MTLIGWFYENCEPFTKEACEQAADRMNYRFEGSEESGTKGCYAYFRWISGKGGEAYFNPGGSEDEMASELSYSTKTHRIRGDDCKSNYSLINLATDFKHYKIYTLHVEL